jgi:hypothetical protein
MVEDGWSLPSRVGMRLFSLYPGDRDDSRGCSKVARHVGQFKGQHD